MKYRANMNGGDIIAKILGWISGSKKKKGNTSLFEGGLHLHFHISINLVRREPDV